MADPSAQDILAAINTLSNTVTNLSTQMQAQQQQTQQQANTLTTLADQVQQAQAGL